MAPASWHSRRRFFVALGIASILLVAGVSAAGFVQVDDSDVPDTFSLPAPKPGDRAAYTYSLVDTTGPEPVRIGQELPMFAFEHGQGTTLVDRDGDVIDAPVRVDAWAWHNVVDDYETNATHWGPFWALTEYGTAQGHAAGREVGLDIANLLGGSAETDPTGLGLVTQSTQADAEIRFFQFAGGEEVPFGALLPCGASSAFQGREVNVHEAVVFEAGCFLYDIPVDPTRPDKQQGRGTLPNALFASLLGPLDAIGWQELERGPALVFRSQATVHGAHSHAWFDPDVPFAVQLAFPAPGGRHHVIRMSALEQVEPAAPELFMSQTPDPVVRAIRSWGPVDAGVDVPFSASDAWQHAIQQDDVRELLDGHQGRLLTQMHGDYLPSMGVRPTGGTAVWSFDMQDDAGMPFGFRVHWSRDAPEEAPAVQTPILLSPLAPSIRVTTWDGDEPDPVIPRRAVNMYVPTVQSAFDTLQSLDGRSREAVSWSATLECLDGQHWAGMDCDAYGYVAAVSNIESRVDPGADADGPSVGLAWSINASYLRLDHTGAMTSFERLALQGDTAFSPTATSKAPPAPANVPAAPGWIPDARTVVAGAGLLGFLVAAVYYFAPGFLGLFSRIREDKMLEHPSRRLLHDAIQGQPGVHHQELVRALGKGRGGAEHHLRKLTAAGLIAATVGPGYTCYFPKRTDRRVIAAGPALRSETARSILATLRDQPGSHGGHVAAELGINRATVSHHLQRMEDAGLIETRRDGRAIRAYPTHVADMVA